VKIMLIYFLSNTFFFILLPAFLIIPGLFLDSLLNLSALSHPPYNLILGLIIIAWGIFWMIWSLYCLVKIGKGHPQEAFGKEFLPATKKLIIIGPYLYCRNPMAFGWFNYAAGIIICFGSISTLFIILPIFLAMAIIYLKYFEENNLMKRFGEDYIKYRESVPLFIPGRIKKGRHE